MFEKIQKTVTSEQFKDLATECLTNAVMVIALTVVVRTAEAGLRKFNNKQIDELQDMMAKNN